MGDLNSNTRLRPLEPLRVLAALVDRPSRRSWIAVALLAVVVTGLELLAALSVFGVLRLITEPEGGLDLPILGDLGARFPGATSSQLVVVLTLGVGVLFLFRAGVLIGHSYLQNRVAHMTGVRLARRLLGLYLEMPYAAHLTSNTAELVRNTNTTVIQVVTSALVPATLFLAEAAIVLGLAVLVAVAAPVVTLVGGAIMGIGVFALIKVVQPRLAEAGRISESATATGFQATQQALAGLAEIQLYRRGEWFLDEFEEARRGLARSYIGRAVLTDIPRVGIETVLVLGVLAALAVTSVTRGTLEGLATLGLVAYGALRIMPSLNRAIAYLSQVRFGMASVRILQSELTRLESESSSRWSRGPEIARITLEAVSFRYTLESDWVLQDVDLEILPGESVGLVGATGSGKSTLVYLIAGLLHPTTGRTLAGERDLASGEVPAGIGLVSQRLFLMDDTIRQNITLGDSRFSDEQIWDALTRACVSDFVRSLPEELSTTIGERGARVSGGQAQRLVIARALIRDPQILIFDEGTSSLDSVTEDRLISSLHTPGERTLVMVAHRLSTVRNCDRIVVLDRGRVIDSGTYADLLHRNDTFRALAQEMPR